MSFRRWRPVGILASFTKSRNSPTYGFTRSVMSISKILRAVSLSVSIFGGAPPARGSNWISTGKGDVTSAPCCGVMILMTGPSFGRGARVTGAGASAASPSVMSHTASPWTAPVAQAAAATSAPTSAREKRVRPLTAGTP